MADINILAINPETRRVTFAFNIVPKKARGMEALLQLCAKTVLTTPGIDIFAPEYGGGLLSYSARGLSTADIPRISADMAHIISLSERQIILEQSATDISPEERLRSLTLLSIDYYEDEGKLDIRALVVSETGEESDISLANQIRFKRNNDTYLSSGVLLDNAIGMVLSQDSGPYAKGTLLTSDKIRVLKSMGVKSVLVTPD